MRRSDVNVCLLRSSQSETGLAALYLRMLAQTRQVAAMWAFVRFAAISCKLNLKRLADFPNSACLGQLGCSQNDFSPLAAKLSIILCNFNITCRLCWPEKHLSWLLSCFISVVVCVVFDDTDAICQAGRSSYLSVYPSIHLSIYKFIYLCVFLSLLRVPHIKKNIGITSVFFLKEILVIIFLSSFHYLASVPHIIPINSNNNIKLLLIIVTYFNDFVRLSPNNHQQKASVFFSPF